MVIIPAIDVKDGRCVRLKQGDMSTATVYSDDPVAVAGRLQSISLSCGPILAA